MIPTEHTSKAPHCTGSFAVLRGLLPVTGTGAPSPGRRLILVGLVALCPLLFAAGSAQAAEVHLYSSSFGGAGSGAGQFKEPQGVAVNDETGDVYVVDKGNDRVEWFNSSGSKFEGQFNGGATFEVGGLKKSTPVPPAPFENPAWVAVDNSTNPLDPSKGDVYVTDNGHKAVDKFSATGEYLGQIAAGLCPEAEIVTIPAGGSAEEEIDHNEQEARRAREKAGCPPGTEVPFAELYGVATDLAGELWVYQSSPSSILGAIDNYSDAAANKIIASRKRNEAFFEAASSPFAVGPEDDPYIGLGGEDPEGAHLIELNSAGESLSEPVSGQGGITAAAVNLSNNELYELYARSGSEVISAAVGSPLERFGSEDLSAGAGIAVNSSTGGALSNSVYVADAARDTVTIFDPAEIPAVASEPATNVEVVREAGHASVAATLHGTVDPAGLPVSSCEFEYGTSTSYGKTVPCEQGLGAEPGEIGDGTSPVPVSAVVKNLLPNATYHFRLRAANANDENNPQAQLNHAGGDQEFPVPFGPSVLSEAPASAVSVTEATVSGVVDPGGLPLSECKFEYAPTGAYDQSKVYSQSTPCEQGLGEGPGEIGQGTSAVPVSAKLTGLLGTTTYSFRLVIATEVFSTGETVSATGPGQQLTTSPVPVVAGAEATDLTATSAVLQASVDPEGVQVTHCSFEYGTSTSYGETAKCEQKKSAIGAGTEPVPVSATLTELQPNTTYHWRLVVTDKHGSSLQGPAGTADHTFIYPTTGTQLPDDRQYEMVTPPFKNGAAIGNAFAYGPQVSGDGSRVIALSIQCFAGSRSCTTFRGEFAEPFEFTRGASGWTTTPLAPPSTTYPENTQWLVSADAGDALFSIPTGPAHEDEWYRESEPGSFERIGPVTPPGITGIGTFNLEAKQSTADLSHLAWEGGAGGEGEGGVHEDAGIGNKGPFRVDVTGAKGSEELISNCGARLGQSRGTAQHRNAMSADGRVIFFTADAALNELEASCPGSGTNADKQVPVLELYARIDGEEPEVDGARRAPETVAISEPDAPEVADPANLDCTSEQCIANTESPVAPATNPNWNGAYFEGASEDGSKVFFTSAQQLTDNATETAPTKGEPCGNGESLDCNLYLYDFDRPVGRRLVDVSETVEHTSVRGGPRVQGVVAISADGSHVYFVAQGKLASNRSALGSEAVAGEDNMYVFDAETGHLAFIATLPRSDHENWLHFRANVTPEGRFLVFESLGRLTPDDHASSAQIFRYDAETEELVRISIGEEGYGDDGNAGTGAATIVPAIVGEEHAGPARGDPTMSNDGAYVFFQSPVALTPHALNDVQIAYTPESCDVYDECSPAETHYAENVYEYHEGHVYLISDGHDTSVTETNCPNISSVCLLGVDETGHNVFFTTTDRLVPKDTDTQLDIYDARLCEPANGNPCIAEPPPLLPPCDGENCHGIPAATPSLLAPGSAGFNGEGNIAPPPPAVVVKPKALTKAQKLAAALKVCKKDRPKAKRKSCEASAQKRYGSVKKSSRKKGK